MQAPTTRPLTTFEPETGAMTPVTLQTRELAARDRALEAFYHPFAYAAATSDGAL
jgi:hypothetical protein